MSIQTSTFGPSGAIETSGKAGGKGFWRRLYDTLAAAREEQARRHVAAYLNGLSESQRKDIGYPSAGDPH